MPKQIDKPSEGGEWFVNMSEYRFPHGLREGVHFEPKEPTCVKPDDWIAGQPVIVKMADPFGELPESPIIEETPLREFETQKPVTGVGTGPDGSGNGDDARKAAEASTAKPAKPAK